MKQGKQGKQGAVRIGALVFVSKETDARTVRDLQAIVGRGSK